MRYGDADGPDWDETLEDKLRAIDIWIGADGHGEDAHRSLTDQEIAEIHKALDDSGYLHGETWLALYKEQCSLSEPETPDEYLEAAERASGIEGRS